MSNRTRPGRPHEQPFVYVAPIGPDNNEDLQLDDIRPCGFEAALEALFAMTGIRVYDVAFDEGVVFLLKDCRPKVLSIATALYRALGATYPTERTIWAIIQLVEDDDFTWAAQ